MRRRLGRCQDSSCTDHPEQQHEENVLSRKRVLGFSIFTCIHLMLVALSVTIGWVLRGEASTGMITKRILERSVSDRYRLDLMREAFSRWHAFVKVAGHLAFEDTERGDNDRALTSNLIDTHAHTQCCIMCTPG